MKHKFWALPLILALGGCAKNEGTTPAGNSPRNLAREFLAARLSGRAYDRGFLALQRADISRLQSAEADLKLAGGRLSLTRAKVESLLAEGDEMMRASYGPPSPQREQMRHQALEKYRAALQLKPDFENGSATDMNSLAYTLADWGETPADFAQAVRLARRSLQLYDEAANSGRIKGRALAQLRFERAELAHDSYAWALFKAGRLDEARREAEAVLGELESSQKAAGGKIEADFDFHLAEILRALGRGEAAHIHYEKALKLKPNAEMAAQIASGLKALS